MSELGKLFALFGYDAERFEDITFLIHLHYRLPFHIDGEHVENYPIDPREYEIEALKKLEIVDIETGWVKGARISIAVIRKDVRDRDDFRDLVYERYNALAEASSQIDEAFRYPLRAIATESYVTKSGRYGSAEMEILNSMEDFVKLEHENPKLALYSYYLQLYNRSSWLNLLDALMIEGWILRTNYLFMSRTIRPNNPHYRVSKELDVVWEENTGPDRMLEQMYHEPDCLAIFCLGILALKPRFDCLAIIKELGLDEDAILERMFEINEEIRTNRPDLGASRFVRFVEQYPKLVVGDPKGYLEELNRFLPEG